MGSVVRFVRSDTRVEAAVRADHRQTPAEPAIAAQQDVRRSIALALCDLQFSLIRCRAAITAIPEGGNCDRGKLLSEVGAIEHALTIAQAAMDRM